MTLKMAKIRVDETSKILAIMESSKFEFIQTGSRYFDSNDNENKINRDWDFFTEYSQEVKDFLLKNGFEDITTTDSGYKDIARTQNIQYILRRGLVDVQLVKDAKGKEVIQTILYKSSMMYSALNNKEERKRLWRLAFGLYYANR